MATTTVIVELDLNDVDQDDLMDEVVERLENDDFKENEVKALKEALGLGRNFTNAKTLEDQAKMEHFERIISKYSLKEIEERLPEWDVPLPSKTA